MDAGAWGWGGLVPLHEAMLRGLLCWSVVCSLHPCAKDSPHPVWWGG